MLDLDIKQFWIDDELAHKDGCFSKEAPQMALGIRMSNECVFAELGEEGNPWGYTDPVRRLDLNKRYNEKALKIVGRKLLSENEPEPEDSRFPEVRQIGEVFGGKYVFNGESTWLERRLFTEEDLIKKLDEIDNMDLRSFILPPQWDSEVKRIYETYGKRPKQFVGMRGPVTLAMSVFGTEDLIYLIYDNPELAVRLSQTITRVILEYIKIFITESGHTAENFQHGFAFSDDDCCLLTPDMYELFGYPILKNVWDFTSPDPGDKRYQHSDSAMEHIIPYLADLGITGCNFGPTVMIRDIRKYTTTATIRGQLAPFTFMSNDEQKIIAEVKRDAEMARENDIRGVDFTTAGSINNGSLLTSLRTVMAAIQNFGRY